MKILLPKGSLLAVLLAAVTLPVAASPATDPGSASRAATAPILYTHLTYDAQGHPQSATLFRVDPATGAVRRLTPQNTGVYRLDGSWSPHGTRIVYTRESDASRSRSQLFTIDANGGAAALLAGGPAQYQRAVWGPGALIALIDGTTSCLSVIRYDGTGLRPLFCPPLPFVRFSALDYPQWSADGKSIFLQGNYVTGLETPFEAFAYRVDVATGFAVSLLDWEFYEPRTLAIAPNGGAGIYGDDANNGQLVRIDFATGVRKSVGRVGSDSGTYYGQHYSPEGCQVAFVHDFYRTVGHRIVQYAGVYVMRADGSHLRRITAEPTSRTDPSVVQETVVDWSGDGSHLLLNRTFFRSLPVGYAPYPSLRIIDLKTNTVAALPKVKGLASEGAWFKP